VLPGDDVPEQLEASGQPALVEGIARVVAIEADLAWLEPEQTTSCGGCASSIVCGTQGIGTTARKLAARRFALANEQGLRVGERIVVGVSERALLKASATAYALPLLSMLGAGGIAQGLAGRDGITMLASVAGLGIGLVAAHWGARWLGARGQLAPQFIRRLTPSDTCQIS
jgi:sigma-E factor negative regulatory protein RseC